MNLIPDKPVLTPNYWCTWGTQGTIDPRACLDEDALFGEDGWLYAFDKIRKDLLVVLDDGWDVPRIRKNDPALPLSAFGSCELSEEKFPSMKGSPAKRMHTLSDKIRSLGWRGLGLWIAAQACGENDKQKMTLAELERYWRERARWCNEAGVCYWKVDWGFHAHDLEFRRMLTRVAREEAPGLTVEHAFTMGPFNDALSATGRFKDFTLFGQWEAEYCKGNLDTLVFSDVLRTYDVSSELSVPTTLDRVAELLRVEKIEPGARGHLNIEDEVYIGAGLGLSIGVMRHSAWNLTHTTKPGLNIPLDRGQLGKRLDEAVRAIRWQRMAAPFGVASGHAHISSETLGDSFEYLEEYAWSGVSNRPVRQEAPAIISRGMPLPKVTCDKHPPFVVASRNPSGGAISVATLPRTINSKLLMMQEADVSIELHSQDVPIGIFGKFASLTLTPFRPREGLRVWAQDLLGDTAVDVTDRVRIEKSATSETSQLVIPGKLISEIGCKNSSPGDLSFPGMVIMIR